MKPYDILPDAEERSRATDPRYSFIVKAPAGSGKTELLIQRILTLLSTSNTPEEVVAITFTKKAAHEMRARVIQALHLAKKEEPNLAHANSAHAKKTWLLAESVLKRDKKFSWQLLENPNRLNIQTIDSLCASLNKELPILSQFGAVPMIDTKPSDLYLETIDDMLSHMAHSPWGPSLAKLILHFDNQYDKLKLLFTLLIKQRDQWMPYLALTHDSGKAKELLEDSIKAIVNEHLIALYQVFPKDILETLSTLIATLSVTATVQNKPFLDNPRIPAPHINDLPKWQYLCDFILTEQGTYRQKTPTAFGFTPIKQLETNSERELFKQYRETFSQMINMLEATPLLLTLLKQAKKLPTHRYAHAEWDLLNDLLLVLKYLLALLRVQFQAQGKIDFIENTQAAILSLGTEDHPTNLAFVLDYQIRHLLIDEFQDTSISQFQLIEKIVGEWTEDSGKTLFIVGDPMQSIYRFRNAEVGLFIKAWQQGIRHIRLTPLTLTVNFRSNQKIVEWNNTVFPKIFPKHNNMIHGAVTYTKSIPHKGDTSDSYHECEAHINNQSEAISIVSRIKTLHQDFAEDSIAILVRARSHAFSIVKELKKQELAFNAADIDNLSQKQTIRDLIALAFALANLTNKTAWLAILRAPWCGLTLHDLLIISSNKQHQIIYERLHDHAMFRELSDDGKKRIDYLRNIFKYILHNDLNASFANRLEKLWYLLGGPATIPDNTSKDDIDLFFNLVKEQGFTLYESDITEIAELIAQSFSSVTSQSSPIHIMTIHAAKGLEFDTVFIPSLEKSQAVDDKPLLAYMEYPLQQGERALLLAPLEGIHTEHSTLYDFIVEQNNMKLHYELDRLLYVAKTRAKKRLILSYVAPSDISSIKAKSFLSRLHPFLRESANHECPKDPQDSVTNDSKINKGNPRIISQFAHTIELPKDRFYLHQKSKGFLLQDNNKRSIGTIIHRLLKLIADRSRGWWMNLSKEHQHAIITRQLLSQAIDHNKIADAMDTILQSLNHILHDTRGLWILESHQAARSEYPITCYKDNEFHQYIIDRTFIDNGIRWIIDYKTALIDPLLIHDEVINYFNQLNKYRMALKNEEQHPIKIGVYFTALPYFHEYNDESLVTSTA